MRRIFTCMLLSLFLAVSLTAANLPGWTDDSALLVIPKSRSFVADGATLPITGRILHPVDVPVTAQWTIDINAPGDSTVRQFSGVKNFEPASAMDVAVVWDGRVSGGAFAAPGLYEIVFTVELKARQGRQSQKPTLRHEDHHHSGRVETLRQTFSETIRIEPYRSRPQTIVSNAAAPHEAGYPYNFYFGTLHTQTAFSDGGHPNTSTCASSTTHTASDTTPAQAYSYARNTAGLDFLGISDHNHQFENACSGCTHAQVIQRYKDGLAAAASATVDGSFVGIYGMEWGYISNPDAGYLNQGHINIYESPKLFGWEPSNCTVGSNCYYEVFTGSNASEYKAMYTKALQNPSAWGAFGQFNHPSDGTKSAAGQGVDYNTFEYTTDGDDFIKTIAVVSGPSTNISTTSTETGARYAGEPVNGSKYSAYTSIDMYNRALAAGFHVAPVTDADTHCSNYGNGTRDRTVILAANLTKASIMDAIHNRRVYATTDRNAQLIFTMNAGGTTHHMGAGSIRANGPVLTSGSITLHTSVFDPEGATVSSIKIKRPVMGATNGSDSVIATGTASPFDYTFTPAAGKHVYYAYVTLSNGDEMWSAPIWIDHASAPDTTAPTTSITAPANGATVSGTTTVTATASDNVGVTKVEIFLDNVLSATCTSSPCSWSWNTTTSANGSHALTSKAYDAANNVGSSTTVSVTVSNVADTTAPSAPTNLSATSPTKRKINLSWTASTDNVGVTGYEIWRATAASGPFTKITTTTTTSYTDASLTSGVIYYYYVKAYDAAGNISAASNTANVKAR